MDLKDLIAAYERGDGPMIQQGRDQTIRSLRLLHAILASGLLVKAADVHTSARACRNTNCQHIEERSAVRALCSAYNQYTIKDRHYER